MNAGFHIISFSLKTISLMFSFILIEIYLADRTGERDGNKTETKALGSENRSKERRQTIVKEKRKRTQTANTPRRIEVPIWHEETTSQESASSNML